MVKTIAGVKVIKDKAVIQSTSGVCIVKNNQRQFKNLAAIGLPNKLFK